MRHFCEIKRHQNSDAAVESTLSEMAQNWLETNLELLVQKRRGRGGRYMGCVPGEEAKIILRCHNRSATKRVKKITVLDFHIEVGKY